jgi:cell division septation protein DedD
MNYLELFELGSKFRFKVLPTAGFVLQVGSFQEFQRADYLKNKLIDSDYPVFISSTWVEEKGQALHRVVVGMFSKKIDAEKIAAEIKESE